MKLTSLFKDALESEDPAVRSRAVGELDSSDPRIGQLAASDASAQVRAAAAARLTDLDSLHRISTTDSDNASRAAASEQLQAVLSGTHSEPTDIAKRVAWLLQHGTEALSCQIARNGIEPELRVAALTRLQEKGSDTLEALCAELATADASADVRQAAVQQVQNAELVEHVLAAAKGHDKRVVQIARERLKQLREAEKHDAQRQHLCDVVEALAENPDGDGNLLVEVSLAARLQVIENEWRQLADSDSLSAKLSDRFNAAADKVREIVAARASATAQQAALQEALQQLQGRAAQSDVPSEVDALLEQWQALQGVTPAQTRAFENHARNVRNQHDVAVRDEQRRKAVEQSLARYEKRLHGDAPLNPGQLKSLEKDWSGQKLPVDAALAEALSARYQALHDSLRDTLKRQKGDSASAAGDLATLLDKLNNHIEAGELSQAISLYDKSHSRLEKATLERLKRAAIDKRMQTFAARIADLKRWRHWGTDKARENLCEAAQALVGKKGKIAVLAQDVRNLRDQWKKLDHADRPARQELWQRFNEICEKAYAPCKAHFDDQSAKRAANLAEKQGLCERLTALAQDTDWEAPEWRKITKIERDTAREFFAVGPVDRKAKKPIEQAFREAQEGLEAHLAGEREKELVRRRGLIRKVEALKDEPDLRTAISTAQQAQKEWAPTVQCDRRQEEQLWKDFRAGCDAVFERRRESMESSKVAATEAEQQRRETCDSIVALGKELENLSPADGDLETHLNQLAGRFKTARSEWRPAPRGARSKAEPRYWDACSAFEKTLKAKRAEAASKERELLAQRAALCSTVEQAALSADGNSAKASDGTAAAEQWMSMPAQRGPLGKALQKRFDTALAACQGDADAAATLKSALEANHAERLRLCLEMEIAADIDSPEEFAKARMEHRIAQLSNALASGGAGDVSKTSSLRALADSWYQTGPVAAADHDTLEARFKRAMQAAGDPGAS